MLMGWNHLITNVKYSDAMIYTQMVYMDKVFDIQKAMQEDKSDIGGGEIIFWKVLQLTKDDIDHIKMACDPFQNPLEELKACVQRFMSKNARMYVDLSTLFSFASLKPALVPAAKALVV
jgi:DNA polymerase alpha subunit A